MKRPQLCCKKLLRNTRCEQICSLLSLGSHAKQAGDECHPTREFPLSTLCIWPLRILFITS
jgi:hypothetical protein